MKKILYTILMCFTVFEVSGQVNLVQNPSFEEYSVCPNDDDGSLIEQANHWSNPNIYSPDYYNSCDLSTSQGYSVPLNNYGYQDARTGNAYVGIITASVGTEDREYIQNELSEILIQGKEYCVSFFVSTADVSKYASNDIGVYFSSETINQPTTLVINVNPQIANNPTLNPLTDKSEWIEVSGSFIAQGTEKYLIIGNFKDEENTDTTHFNDNATYGSYHYIDDVSVTMCNELSINEFDDLNELIYPNPFTDILTINIENLDVKRILITDLLGNNLKSLKEENNIKRIIVETSHFPKGIYLLEIETNNRQIIKKIIKN